MDCLPCSSTGSKQLPDHHWPLVYLVLHGNAPGTVNLYLVIDRTIFSLYFPVPTCVALPKKVLWNKVLVVLLQIGANDHKLFLVIVNNHHGFGLFLGSIYFHVFVKVFFGIHVYVHLQLPLIHHLLLQWPAHNYLHCPSVTALGDWMCAVFLNYTVLNCTLRNKLLCGFNLYYN